MTPPMSRANAPNPVAARPPTLPAGWLQRLLQQQQRALQQRAHASDSRAAANITLQVI